MPTAASAATNAALPCLALGAKTWATSWRRMRLGSPPAVSNRFSERMHIQAVRFGGRVRVSYGVKRRPIAAIHTAAHKDACHRPAARLQQSRHVAALTHAAALLSVVSRRTIGAAFRALVIANR